MAKYLNDIGFSDPPPYEGRKGLAPSGNFLRFLYLDCLPGRLKTDGISKVVVQPCSKLEGEALKLIVNPNVIQLSKIFDFDNYAASDKETRKHIALNFLHEGLLAVAKAKGWESEPLRVAYEQCLLRGLVFRHPWSESISRSDRKFQAQAWCCFDSDKADISIALLKCREVLSEHFVTSVDPGAVWINDAVGSLEWISTASVRLTSRDASKSWKVTFQSLK